MRRLNSSYEDELLPSKLKEIREKPLVRMADVLFTERMKNRISEWHDNLLQVRNGMPGCPGSSDHSNQLFQTIFYKMHPALKLDGFTSRQLRLIQLVMFYLILKILFFHSVESCSESVLHI